MMLYQKSLEAHKVSRRMLLIIWWVGKKSRSAEGEIVGTVGNFIST